MRIKITQVLTFFLFYTTACAEKSYHSTDTLLTRIKLKCAAVPQLSCHMKDDILIVDWNKNIANKSDVLLVFNEHARERITGEVALKVIHKLRKWQPKKRVTIIPVLNVWGRKRVEAGHPCQRKNERAVDINRNYQMRRVNVHHYAKNSEEYEGPHPLSEKESKLVSSLLLNGVQRYVNVHSGEKSIYMPYDSRVGVRPKNYDVMLKNIKKWAQKCPECAVGTGASTSFYRAYGTSVDWAVDHGVPEGYTLEIYGDVSFDCNRMFNPNKRDLHSILKQWSGIIKDIIFT
jgi:hypothetical protein